MVDTTVRSYDTSTVGGVVHGIGAIGDLPRLLDELNSTRLVVATSNSVMKKTPLLERLGDLLGDSLAAVAPPIGAHTPASDVAALEKTYAEAGGDALLALGGSSVADGAKIAALRLGGVTPQVVVTDGIAETAERRLADQPIPLIAVPTTLSAGEFTHGAGMVADGHGGKVMTMDDRLPPRAVIFDPEVTLFTPRELWLSTGVKAIDHAAETIWGTRSHPLGDALSTDALRLLTDSLTVTAAAPGDLDARLASQLAAWMSIATMKNTSLHLSHILEHCMGTHWHLSHGITSCIALPTVMDHLAQEMPAKVATVARAMGTPSTSNADDTRVARDGAVRLREWIARLGLPNRLRDVVADRSGFDDVAGQSVLALSYFGYVPAGGADTIKVLLDRMW